MVDLDTKMLRGRDATGAPRDAFGLVGQVLDEQFRVEGVLGEGGFSVVYRGTHLGLSEPIAIKCLKLPTALGSAAVESFVQRFRDEGRILYKLSQGNLHIVRSIASGLTMGPLTGALIPYLVLEWLAGHSLASELESRRRAGHHGRPLAELVPLLDSAVLAVAYAHSQGVVHRDLNPGNIFFAETREGVRAKVLDFGLAKVVSDHAMELGPRAETLSHLQIFAPAYAAPEQMDKRIGPVGPWTDVYTLALVVLEAMADRSVVEGEHVGEIMAKTLGLHRPSPRGMGLDVTDEVEQLFASAFELDPTKRPSDAGVFWGELKHRLPRAPRKVIEPVAVSPMDAFRNLPAPVAGAPPPSFAGVPPPSKQPGLGATLPLSGPRQAPGAADPSGPVSGGRSGAFPRLASTMPLGDAASFARARASLPQGEVPGLSVGGVPLGGAAPGADAVAATRGEGRPQADTVESMEAVRARGAARARVAVIIGLGVLVLLVAVGLLVRTLLAR